MTPLEQLSVALGVVLAVVSIAKAGFAIAQFFAELSANVRLLTEAVRMLTAKIDGHVAEVSDLRERVVSLESWREEMHDAA